MKRLSQKGIGLIEVLIAGTIFLLITGFLSLFFVQGVRIYHKGEESSYTFREASRALDIISREISFGGKRLYHSSLKEYSHPGRSSIIFTRYDPLAERNEIIGYSYNEESKQIVRTTYDPDSLQEGSFLKKEAFKPLYTQVLARGVNSLSFHIDDKRLIVINIQLTSANTLLQTRVRNSFISRGVFVLR